MCGKCRTKVTHVMSVLPQTRIIFIVKHGGLVDSTAASQQEVLGSG